jgi:hypothetical protein
VILKVTALAVAGKPQAPSTPKLRVALAASAGGLVLRVSMTRHGARLKKLYGPTPCACAGTAAASVNTPARIARLVFVMVISSPLDCLVVAFI